MKAIFSAIFLFTAFIGSAQPKLIGQATINTTTNVIAPEDEDVAQIGNNPGGGPGAGFRNFGDGETKSVTFVKNDLVKTNYKSEMASGAVYRNNSTKVTTTIAQIMGNKIGFYASDNDMENMAKKRDSLMKAQAKTDSTIKPRQPRNKAFDVAVVNTDETKKIAGYNCKKAFLVTDKVIAKDSLVVWYTPEIKFNNLSSTGGTSGFGSFGNIAGFDKIDGFVMQYERSMPRGRKMEVKVTKIDTVKEIADKEFDLPKDVEIKPMSEMTGAGNFFGVRRGN